MSVRGRKYATSLAKYMNEAAVPGLRVLTSELKRTHQTAAGIKAPAEHLAALNELEAVSKLQYLLLLFLCTVFSMKQECVIYK